MPRRRSRPAVPGRRRAERRGIRRAVRVLAPVAVQGHRPPPVPAVVGTAALVLATAGAVAAGSTDAAPPAATEAGPRQASALDVAASGGAPASVRDTGTHRLRDRRGRLVQVSRGGARAELEQQAEQRSARRTSALRDLARAARDRADQLRARQWVLPLAGYTLTASFGETSSLWSSTHTGQDFAAAEGTTLVAIAPATVTSTSYDGAYGNKTVLTLEDGTELWYCHQSSIEVSRGDQVDPGEAIGAVGSTGNVTGPHLHLEVRPDGGDPVDPVPVLARHGVTP